MSADINRRQVLQRVSALMGGALSAPVVLALLSGCAPNEKATWKPVFLSEEQGALVAAIAEIIIPRTDTPGALDVGIPAFIDTMLHDTYSKEEQARFTTGLAQFEQQAQWQHSQAFLMLEPARRVALTRSVHDAAVAEERSRFVGVSSVEPRRPFILMLKELTLLGYFTSEAGATQVLQYLPIPGAYRACVPLSQAGKGRTWASETISRF